MFGVLPEECWVIKLLAFVTMYVTFGDMDIGNQLHVSCEIPNILEGFCHKGEKAKFICCIFNFLIGCLKGGGRKKLGGGLQNVSLTDASSLLGDLQA